MNTLTVIQNFSQQYRWLLIIILLYVFYQLYTFKPANTDNQILRDNSYEGFQSIKVGGNAYKIHEDLTDPYKAAETMDQLNGVAQRLIKHLTKKYIHEPAGYHLIKKEYQKIVMDGVKALKLNFKSANMEENIPERSKGDTSYVIDKGDVFAMCLRDPNNGNQIDSNFNALTFVLIHELSHIFCSEWGHTSLFWHNFRFLLQEATDIGLYTLVDYKKHGSPYCGIVITYCPIHDKTLHDYRK